MDSAAAKLNSMKKFDADASNYEQTSDGKFCARIYPAILAELNRNEGQTILDVGCGTGILLSQVKEGNTLCGLDLSPGMIEQAKTKLGDRAELIVGDAERLPWPEGFFDTILCSFSFHHYPKPDAVLRGLKNRRETNPCRPLDAAAFLADTEFDDPVFPQRRLP